MKLVIPVPLFTEKYPMLAKVNERAANG